MDQTQNEAFLKAELESELKLFQERMKQMQTEVREGKSKVDQDMIEKELRNLYDPYVSQDPLKILKDLPPEEGHSKGWALRWCSPRYRSGSATGMAGWEPLKYGDKYTGEKGENLQGYISTIPVRFESGQHLDNHVRCMDLILCRLDKRIWESRQRKRVLLDALQRGQFEVDGEMEVREGVKVTHTARKSVDNPLKGIAQGAPVVESFDKTTGEGVHRTVATAPITKEN